VGRFLKRHAVSHRPAERPGALKAGGLLQRNTGSTARRKMDAPALTQMDAN
jgi:hypothetical protein